MFNFVVVLIKKMPKIKYNIHFMINIALQILLNVYAVAILKNKLIIVNIS